MCKLVLYFNIHTRKYSLSKNSISKLSTNTHKEAKMIKYVCGVNPQNCPFLSHNFAELVHPRFPKKLFQGVIKEKLSKTVIKAVSYIYNKTILIILIQECHHNLIQTYHHTLFFHVHIALLLLFIHLM